MPLTADRLNQIQKEEVLGGPKSQDADEEERVFRRAMARDVKKMKRVGVEIAFLKVDPDIDD